MEPPIESHTYLGIIASLGDIYSIEIHCNEKKVIPSRTNDKIHLRNQSTHREARIILMAMAYQICMKLIMAEMGYAPIFITVDSSFLPHGLRRAIPSKLLAVYFTL